MFCEERERLKQEVAQAARIYIEAADMRKDAQAAEELVNAQRREREAHRIYNAARAALEKHYREHGCLREG